MADEGINPNHTPRTRAYQDTVIASGQTTSDIVNIGGLHVVGIRRPAGTGITSLTFEVSSDGSNFFPLKNQANEDVTVTMDNNAAHQSISNIMDFENANHVRCIANSAVAANVTLHLILAAV